MVVWNPTPLLHEFMFINLLDCNFIVNEILNLRIISLKSLHIM
jgi:hypothetical protein